MTLIGQTELAQWQCAALSKATASIAIFPSTYAEASALDAMPAVDCRPHLDTLSTLEDISGRSLTKRATRRCSCVKIIFVTLDTRYCHPSGAEISLL